jgi:short-subunit dehydrogenase
MKPGRILGRAILRRAPLKRAGLTVAAGLAVAWLLRERRRYRFDGRVVVITGGSRGLGLALARNFLQRGAKLALLARDADELERARQQLRAAERVLVRACDLRDQNQVEQAFADIRRELGPIDVLINNAGTLVVGPVDTMTADEFREALEIFFWAPYYTTMAAAPDMRARHSGRIVNISSIGGKISVPHLLPYSVGKFALAGFSEGMRAELSKDGVYVTTVYPGLMRTGSPRNAEFKGKHRAEYAWFVLSDALPGLSTSADHAARRIVRACEYGSAELVITLPAKLAIKVHQLFPEFSSVALALANLGLPKPGGLGEQKAKGFQSASTITESWLTVLDRKAAMNNNQIPPKAVNI